MPTKTVQWQFALLVGLAVLVLLPFGRANGTEPPLGVVEGSVNFKIDVPPAQVFKVKANADVCGASHTSEEFIVSPGNQGLKNVVILLSAASTATAPAAEVTLDQKGCAYHPHVQVMTTGSKLVVTNSDPTFHNVHAYQVKSDSDRPTLFNVAQPAGSAAVSQAFEMDAPGLVEFQCDVHEWMRAYVYVHNNPYHAVTDADGHYRIEGVPAGDYTLKIWHEGLGSIEKPVTVNAGGTTTMDFPVEGN